MITLAALQEKIKKEYQRLLQTYVLQTEQWPLYIRIDKKLPDDFAERSDVLEQLYSHSEHHLLNGYKIETSLRKTRLHGMQEMPVAFVFTTRKQLLGYLGKEEVFDAFAIDVDFLLQQFPRLQNWLALHTATVVEWHGKWSQVAEVLQYFLNNPCPGVFARQISLQQSGTKFIEQHKTVLYNLLDILLPDEAKQVAFTGLQHFEARFGLRLDNPRIRFRWLDEKPARLYTGGLMDITASLPELAAQNWQVENIIVLENKTNLLNADLYLSLPLLSNSMAVFGSGRAVVLLQQIPWMKAANIWYWGDIDAEGFEILHDLIQIFPDANAFCMDEKTFTNFSHEHSNGSGAKARELTFLTDNQQELYQYVCRYNKRLEQERVTHEWVCARWREVGH